MKWVYPLIFVFLLLPLVSGQVLHYPLDVDSSVAGDASGNGNDGAINGATYLASGYIGGAYSFDGVDDYIQVPYSSSWSKAASDQVSEYTIAMWVRVGSNGDYKPAMKIGPDLGDVFIMTRNGGWSYDIPTAGGSNGWGCAGNTGALGYVQSPDNSWHHIALTINTQQGRCTFYSDGTQVGYDQYVDGFVDMPASDMFIAGNPAQAVHFLAADIDDVRLYTSELTASEINNLASSGGQCVPVTEVCDGVDNDCDGQIDEGCSAGDTITLDSSTTYQTINGWEGTTQLGHLDCQAGFSTYQPVLVDKIVNELGINRVRLELRSGTENPTNYFTQYVNGQITFAEWKNKWYEIINDDNDPNNINPSGFQWAKLDNTIDNVVVPMRNAVQANGENLYINLNYVDFASSSFEHYNQPEEYAELILATFQHMQSKYGFVPDSVEIILEPDNSAWTGTHIGNVIVATANKLQANGFQVPEFVAPSNTNMGTSITYFDNMMSVPGASNYISEYAYHRYSGVSDSNLQQIATRAQNYGIRTGMLEHIGSGIDDLYKDLTLGRNSAWQQFALAYCSPDSGAHYYIIDNSDPNNPTVTLSSTARYLSQYFKYVRRGAQRIAASSSNSIFQPLAFINSGGGYAVVVKAGGSGTFSIQGLPADTYGITYTTNSQLQVSQADQIISAGQALSTSIPSSGVITIFSKSGTSSCTPTTEVCDGVDNDCDGTVDEGVTNACGTCGAVPSEVCDGVDNDCDGLVDEGVTNACGTCGAVPSEVCDGVDNDCDGTVDEGCSVQTLQGDLNNDGTVDILDVQIVAQDIGKSSNFDSRADRNSDGVINIFDLVLVAKYFGSTSGSGGSGSSSFDGPAELPRAEVDFSMPSTTNTITVKPSGGDFTTLQAAWNSITSSGRTANTEIVIDAGYNPGPLSTGAQAGDDTYWVVIRSSNSGNLPRNVRVGPGDKPDMAQLVVPAGGPALDVGANTKRVRFVGISTETGPSSYPTYHAKSENSAQYIIFDRCLADGGYGRGEQSRIGYGLNGQNIGLIDSYIFDINQDLYESKAILVISGSGPYTFVNNFLEAGSINILFGGANPGSDALIPRDITFARNYNYKNPVWASDSNVATKNNFEIKHGIRFLVEDNAFENFWDVAQGHMIKIKSVDGYGAIGYAQDVTFRYNTMENFDGGIALGAQPTNSVTGLSAPYPLQKVSIHDNEATNGGFDNTYYDGPTEHAISFNGGIDYLDISHNDFRGSFSNQVVNDGSVNNGLIFEYNIIDQSNYGFSDASSIDVIAPGGSVTGNILAPATWNTFLPASNCITWPPPDANCPNAGVTVNRHASTKSGDFSSDPWY